jgi:FlaG/FlaF family flagellin (archaellin)
MSSRQLHACRTLAAVAACRQEVFVVVIRRGKLDGASLAPTCRLRPLTQGSSVSVDFTAASGAFPAGWTPKSGTVTFQPGDTSQSVPFTWACDSADDDDRAVTITLSNPTGPLTVSATNGAATLTVQDDDAVRFSGWQGKEGCLPGKDAGVAAPYGVCDWCS